MFRTAEIRWIVAVGSVVIFLRSMGTMYNIDASYQHLILPSKEDFSLLLDDESAPSSDACPMSMTRIQNKIFIQDNTTQSLVPKQIHIVIRSKCVTADEMDILSAKWEVVDGHSVLFHDEEDANELLAKYRPAFPQLIQLTQCLTSGVFKTEIVKLLLLWDMGGIVLDESIVPGNMLGTIIQDADQGIVLLNGDKDATFYSEYMASAPAHPIVYTLLQKTVVDLFMQYTNSSFIPLAPKERKSAYFDFIMKYIFTNSDESKARRMIYSGMNHSVTIINITNEESQYFQNASSPHIFELRDSEATDTACLDWNELNDETAISSIQTLVHSSHVQCVDGLYYIHDIVNPQSISPGRKIPKIIHLTSKTRCVTKAFADNVKTWYFDGYSVFLHDDEAIARLYSRDWPEFPLLKDTINCITSGAGFADLWRYLILWKYGGIYTDLDNAPGPLFQNGTLIKDDDDAFFEVEAAKFPSQYFLAASPQHPAMYMAVQNTIQHLFNEQNIVKQYVPLTTGPGALKWGVHYAIGNAYLLPGKYPSFDSRRSITIVGNRTTAMRRSYINRGSVTSTRDEYISMNMTHYHYAGRQKGLPEKSCIEIIFDMNIHGKYSDLLGLNRLSPRASA
jgi:mannosyltransferase OCH1-like enzyme